MGPGLHEFNLASHLVWWIGGLAMAVLGVVALLEVWDWVRGWRSRRDATGEATPSVFRVTEDRSVRKHHYRRFRPGYRSLRSRGEAPIRKAGEWSPTTGARQGRTGTDEAES